MKKIENTALQMIAEASRCPDYGPDMVKSLMKKLDMNEKGFALLMNRRTARPPSRARMVAYLRLGSDPNMYPCRYSALWKSSAVLASSQAWSMASRIRAYRAGSLALGCSTTDKPYSRHSLSDAARNSAYWLRRCSYFLPST